MEQSFSDNFEHHPPCHNYYDIRDDTTDRDELCQQLKRAQLIALEQISQAVFGRPDQIYTLWSALKPTRFLSTLVAMNDSRRRFMSWPFPRVYEATLEEHHIRLNLRREQYEHRLDYSASNLSQSGGEITGTIFIDELKFLPRWKSRCEDFIEDYNYQYFVKWYPN